jgi:alkanesulfonate monooxygenase SsuD/methylene tetrahydromethanopterin reductase-like flavin-dependent oxidoreductase (luciferase family)
MAANNDPAVKRAARMADAWFINPHATSDTIRRQMAVYRAELEHIPVDFTHSLHA